MVFFYYGLFCEEVVWICIRKFCYNVYIGSNVFYQNFFCLVVLRVRYYVFVEVDFDWCNCCQLRVQGIGLYMEFILMVIIFGKKSGEECQSSLKLI